MVRRHLRFASLLGVLCCVATGAYAADAATEDTAAEPTHGYFVASDGLKIHYLTLGRGVPVVLIHGYTGSAEGNWFRNGIAAALAKNQSVVALDCRTGRPAVVLDR